MANVQAHEKKPRRKYQHRTYKELREQEPEHTLRKVGETSPEQMELLHEGLFRALAPTARADAFEAWLKLAIRWGLLP